MQVHQLPYRASIAYGGPSRNISQAGKTVLITGGHTGIGFAIARAFAQASAERVIIVGCRAGLVTSSASRLGSQFPDVQASGRACDVSDIASADALWADLAKEGIFIDVVVLNAAKLSTKPILEVGRDAVWSEYLLSVRANLDFAETAQCQGASKGMKLFSRFREYALVNLSSLAIHNFTLTRNQPSYGASKSAGTVLLQRIAEDVSPEDMQIVSYHPGGVFTELAEQVGLRRDDPQWDDKDLPGQFAVWAASEEAKFLHGRFVWAKWDVGELQKGPLREQIDADPEFLQVSIKGM